MNAISVNSVRDTDTNPESGLNESDLLNQAGYDPDRLLDALLKKMRLKNDAALASTLKLHPPVLSNMRHRKIPIGPAALLRMHIVSDLSVRELCGLMVGEAAPVSKQSALQVIRKLHR